MAANDQERMYRYLDWSREDLTAALEQAEGDIKDLKQDLAMAEEERDQYHEESRESAKILGGILRVMADNGMFLNGLGPLIREEELPDVAPRLAQRAARDRRSVRADAPLIHRYAATNEICDVCECGTQWLRQAERCASQPVKL